VRLGRAIDRFGRVGIAADRLRLAQVDFNMLGALELGLTALKENSDVVGPDPIAQKLDRHAGDDDAAFEGVKLDGVEEACVDFFAKPLAQHGANLVANLAAGGRGRDLLSGNGKSSCPLRYSRVCLFVRPSGFLESCSDTCNRLHFSSPHLKKFIPE